MLSLGPQCRLAPPQDRLEGVPAGYSASTLHKKREKVAGKTIVLLTTVVLCLLRMSVAYPQVDTARSAEDSQQSESPQLSLADLDALIEDDADEDLAEVIRGQIFDLLVLSGFLSLALVSFFKNSSTLSPLIMEADNLGTDDPEVISLNLTADEQVAIIAFLHTLTDHQFLSDPNFGSPFE